MVLGWVDIIIMQASEQQPLKNIPLVTISPAGQFKYILITCKGHSQGKPLELPHYFLRGDHHLEYHKQNFQKFIQELKSAGFEIKARNSEKGHFEAVRGSLRLRFECPGGGRIQHNYEGKKCNIYGYSKSYGRVDHKIAQRMISAALNYPLQEITTSQEGY